MWKTSAATVYTFRGEVMRDDPDDPTRTAIRQMAGVFADMKRRMIVKQMRDRRRAKAAKGECTVGPAPYGWTSAGGETAPVPAQQTAFDLMRRLAADGCTLAAIATHLAAESHPTKRGGTWSQPTVSRILRRDADRTPAQVAHHASGFLASVSRPVN